MFEFNEFNDFNALCISLSEYINRAEKNEYNEISTDNKKKHFLSPEYEGIHMLVAILISLK